MKHEKEILRTVFIFTFLTVAAVSCMSFRTSPEFKSALKLKEGVSPVIAVQVRTDRLADQFADDPVRTLFSTGLFSRVFQANDVTLKTENYDYLFSITMRMRERADYGWNCLYYGTLTLIPGYYTTEIRLDLDIYNKEGSLLGTYARGRTLSRIQGFLLFPVSVFAYTPYIEMDVAQNALKEALADAIKEGVFDRK